jgi:hypothetical protein
VNLAELQQHFWSTVRERGTPPRELEGLYRSSDQLSATERMRIYHLAYWGRQLKVLADAFPEVHALLGEEAFTRTAVRYLKLCPSSGPRIEDIAPGFAEFVGALDPPLAMVGQVAALEAAALEALVAPEPRHLATATDIDPARFAGATLTFVESLKVLEVGCEALARVAPKAAGPELPSTAKCVSVATWRKRFVVRTRVLEPAEVLAYSLASRGENVANICAALYDANPEAVTERASALISRWLAREWIAHFGGEGRSNTC